MQACTKPKTTSLTPTVGPLRASSKLRRKNSTKKGKNRQKRITPTTHVNEEAIRKVLEDIAAEKMAKMASEGDSPMLACRDDGSIRSSARSSGSETKLDSSTDVPSAQMKAKVKSATLGRTMHERSITSSELSVDGLSAEEGMRMRSATLGKIKREKNKRNGESFMCSLRYSNSQESAMHAPSSCAMYTVLSCRMLYIRTVSVITYVECSHSQYHIHPQSLCSKCDPIVAT